MRRWFIHIVLAIVGASVGITILPSIWRMIGQEKIFLNHEIFNILIGAIIFIILSLIFSGIILSALRKVDAAIRNINLSKLIFNVIGAVLGLLVGVLASIPLGLLNVPILSNVISFLLILALTYLGYITFHTRGEEILRIFSRRRRDGSHSSGSNKKETFSTILLDTSSVIDGRIIDVINTGFISDKILIPNFVILELQLISDSADNLKRAKGRRGLDLVNELKKFEHVEISKKDYSDLKEVDTKLLRYASEIGAKLVTNDFNLNKVAEIQGVRVLNINDLANALKTQLVVGEEIQATIVKAGTERQQGIAYLPDGTMIVIEDTANKIDQTVHAEVTKVLQTSAGRMVFAELIK